MNKQSILLDLSKLSDQRITDQYCRELLKVKGSLHFRGKIDLGEANIALLNAYRQELKQRGLIIPHLHFRVRVP